MTKRAAMKAATSRSMFFLLLLGLMVVTILVMYSVPLRSLHTKHFLPQFTALRSLIKNTRPDSPIQELLHNISNQVKVFGVDCVAIFNGYKNETAAAKNQTQNASTPLSDTFYLNATVDCGSFQKQRGYIMSSLTEEEEQFPLAYSMMVYKDSEMVERLLRAIYRPQNLYCIHVDQKATNEFFAAISAIAKCFSNVFIATRRIHVVWGTFTVLEPELVCMEEMWRYRHWKYFINLTGQEFPLKTNYEIVKILNAYDGAVDVYTTIKYANKKRWKNLSPPHGLMAVKGSVHIVVNRDFVHFVLHNKTASDLLLWTKKTLIPDETYFAMLNANPKLGIRGTYTGQFVEHNSDRPFLARFKNWIGQPCAGKFIREICILTIGDLPMLANASQLFANKFFLQEDRVVIGCLEEKIFNDTRDEYMGSKTFNTTYYENLDFVKHKVD